MSEQISALIDDEIAVEDAAHLVAAMQSNKQSVEAWGHYCLIGDAMRGNVAFSRNFKSNLMQKLELEPTVLAPSAAHVKSKKLSDFKDKLPVTWSIAASFAAVMLVGWMALHQQTQSSSPVTTMEIAKADAAEQSIPAEYLMAHHASAPSASSYYIQSASYSE